MLPSDIDKPHRCPECWRIPDEFYAGKTVRFWRSYTCQNGHRFGQRYQPWYWLITWPIQKKWRYMTNTLWEWKNG